MHIEIFLLFGLCDEPVRDRISGDPKLSGKVDASKFRVKMSPGEPDFKRVVEITRDLGSGLVWTPWVEYSSAEVKSSGHFEVWPRRSISAGSLWKKNRDLLWESEPAETLPGLFVKTLRQVRIQSLEKIQKNVVGNLADSYMELIAGGAAVETFASCSLRGLTLNPVLCGREQEPHPEFFHMGAKNFAPRRATRDASTKGDEKVLDGPLSLRRLGSLSYEAESFPETADFWRTAEGWHGGQPLWIVSKRVANCFSKGKLKGLSFRPVLTVGSELHRIYLEQWDQLLSRMAGNPRNRLW